MASADPLRLLLVDDAETVRWTWAALFEDAGYVVTEAESVADGRAKLRSGFEVVILDVQLPDGLGIELIADVKERSPSAVIAIISGANIDRPEGADLVFVKSASPDETLQELSRYLAERRAPGARSPAGC